MARYDLHANPDGPGYLLDVQADLLAGLNTRIVVPLMPQDAAPPARRLNPVLTIAGQPHVMVTQFMAAVPRRVLSAPVTSLAAHETEIGNALDMVFVGF